MIDRKAPALRKFLLQKIHPPSGWGREKKKNTSIAKLEGILTNKRGYCMDL